VAVTGSSEVVVKVVGRWALMAEEAAAVGRRALQVGSVGGRVGGGGLSGSSVGGGCGGGPVGSSG